MKTTTAKLDCYLLNQSHGSIVLRGRTTDNCDDDKITISESNNTRRHQTPLDSLVCPNSHHFKLVSYICSRNCFHLTTIFVDFVCRLVRFL